MSYFGPRPEAHATPRGQLGFWLRMAKGMVWSRSDVTDYCEMVALVEGLVSLQNEINAIEWEDENDADPTASDAIDHFRNAIESPISNDGNTVKPDALDDVRVAFEKLKNRIG